MASGKYGTYETVILELILMNADPSMTIGGDVGVRGSSVAGYLYVALFTANPTETGSIADECDYTGYAREAVARDSDHWSVSAGVGTNDQAITFDTCTGGTNTATHFGICKASTPGVADLIFYGELSAPLAISTGVTPQIQAEDLTITED